MTMEEMKLSLAGKLIRLRKQAGLTQAELGEKLSYSDKAVSKWERGESMPDAYVLSQMARLYGTTVDSLLSEAEPWMDPVAKKKKEDRENAPRFSGAFVTLTAIMAIWTMAVIMFVSFWLLTDQIVWLVFVCAVPLSLITLLIFNSIWNKGRRNLIIVMALTACVVAFIYLLFLHRNPWQLFLILVPAEALVVLSFHIRKRDGREPD